MVFGFFSRKPTATTVAGSTDDVPTTTTTTTTTTATASTTTTIVDSPPAEFKFPKDKTREQHQLHTPAPSVSMTTPITGLDDLATATPPPPTPSPPPRELVKNPKALYDLISSVPAQTLHAYCLAKLNPANYPSASPKSRKRKAAPTAGTTATAILSRGTHTHRKSLSSGQAIPEPNNDLIVPPEILTSLTTFLSTLTPPPKLHCVRCHKGYFDLENTDSSCRVPHDDDSAIVERVGVSLTSDGATYETLWGCCGKTVEGDGDQGPPDGWCYEGLHTTDTRRARFRADSTPQEDKLQSCVSLRCFNPRAPVSHSDGSSDGRPVRVKRKRAAKDLKEEDDKDEVGSTSSSVKRRRKEDDEGKKAKKRKGPISPEEVNTTDDEEMDVDPTPRSPPPSPRKRGRPPKSAAKATPPPSSRSVKPRSKLSDVTTLERETRSASRTRSPVRGSATLKKKQSAASLKAADTDVEAAPVKRGRGRPRKSLGEVVASSVANEVDMA